MLAAPGRVAATCDLLRGTARANEYIGLLLVAERNATKEQPVNLRPLARFIERYAALPECNKDVKAARQYFYSPQCPEFTVCQSCFEGVVREDRDQEKPIANSFPAAPNGSSGSFTCSLYSTRMKQMYASAVAGNNMTLLQQKAATRAAKERELSGKIDVLKMKRDLAQKEARQYFNLYVKQSMSEQMDMITISSNQVSVVDHRQSNYYMAQSNKLDMEANLLNGEIRILAAEWANNWE